jgi:hypothetical protein
LRIGAPAARRAAEEPGHERDAHSSDNEACGERIPCLTESYAARISALNEIIDGIASRGPY